MARRRVIGVAAWSLALLVLTGSAHAAQPAPPSSLCPAATDRQSRSIAYRRSDNVISAPATPAETAAQLVRLRTGQGQARTLAIIVLALAGDLDAFAHLLAGRDASGLSIYAGYYLNRDGTACIAAELEQALRDHLSDPALGRALVGVLGRNTYRTEQLLDALRRIPFDPARASAYLPFGRAITATHLPRIEAQVLDHARTLPPFAIPAEKYTLPGLHRHYVKFFAARHYAPAVPYLRELLVQADRDEPVQSFQIEYGMLRTIVQRALVDLGGREAVAVYLEELQAIAARPLDVFAASELQTLAGLASRALQNEADRVAGVGALGKVLATVQPARFDFRTRSVIYEALAGLDGSEGGSLLIAELERFVASAPRPNRRALVPKIFAALGRAGQLDVTPLLAFAGDLAPPHEPAMLRHLLSVHPSDEGVDHLLAELRRAYAAAAGAGAAEQPGGREDARVLLKSLTTLRGPTYQRRARDGMDALVAEGVMPERDYLAAAAALNTALGDESPRHAAFRAERAAQRKAREEAEVRERMGALQGEFEAELARQSTPEAVAGHVAMLVNFGGEARRAARWLILAGEPVLPALHAALAAPGTSDKQTYQLLSVLREIGSPHSTGPIIGAAQARADGGLHGPALLALALLPVSAEAVAFAQAQLVAGVSPPRQAAALFYLARIRHAPAAARVEAFTRLDLPPRVRSAGLYLGARLGVPGLAASVATGLEQATDRGVKQALLRGLAAAAADGAEFQTLAEASGFTEASRVYQQNLAYCRFRTALSGDKADLAYRVLESGQTWDRREAIRYLIDADPQGTVDRLAGGIGRFMPLHELLALSAPVQLLFGESRRLGYRLTHTGQGYALKKI
jgi:hypothetical protein